MVRNREASCRQPHEWTISEADAPAAVKPSDTCSPGWCLDYNQVRDLELEPFRLSHFQFLAYRNSEIRLLLLKSPSFGVTCCVAIDAGISSGKLFIWLTSSHPLRSRSPDVSSREAFTNLVPQDLTRCVFLGLPRCPVRFPVPIFITMSSHYLYFWQSHKAVNSFKARDSTIWITWVLIKVPGT